MKISFDGRQTYMTIFSVLEVQIEAQSVCTHSVYFYFYGTMFTYRPYLLYYISR
jgi:hypothetical protein